MTRNQIEWSPVSPPDRAPSQEMAARSDVKPQTTSDQLRGRLFADHAASIHATCVLVGARAVLIRGPSGSGKSRLALALMQCAARGDLCFARLVSDDRTLVEAAHGRLLARPVPQLAGLLELRGFGIQLVGYEPVAAVGLVVDLAAAAERMPDPGERETELAGITLPRLAIAPQADPLPLVLAALAKNAS
jgi:HPr kinase/phosphorylase